MTALAIAEEPEPAAAPPRRTRGHALAGAGDVTIHVGRRIRERRVQLGMRQAVIAADLGISHQQMNKFERGANRLPVPTLYLIANILDVGVEYFFEGLQSARQARRSRLGARETLELTRSYYAIADENHRRAILDLVRKLGRGKGAPA